MSVSLDVYRAAIGIFNFTAPYRTKTYKGPQNYTPIKSLIILLILLLHSPPICNKSYESYTQSKLNKNSHTRNGNIKYKSINILHWNKGNALFYNKFNDILSIIEKNRPKIMSISEANYNNLDKLRIEDYNIKYTDMGVGYSISRQILLIHNSLQYKRRRDLEEKYLSIIICQVKINKNSHLNIIGHYRQWQLPREIQNNAQQYNTQEFRYTKTIEIFNNILDDRHDTVIIGDDNIDTLNNHNLYHNSNNILIKNTRDEFIIKNNITVHNKKATFHRKKPDIMH